MSSSQESGTSSARSSAACCARPISEAAFAIVSILSAMSWSNSSFKLTRCCILSATPCSILDQFLSFRKGALSLTVPHSLIVHSTSDIASLVLLVIHSMAQFRIQSLALLFIESLSLFLIESLALWLACTVRQRGSAVTRLNTVRQRGGLDCCTQGCLARIAQWEIDHFSCCQLDQIPKSPVARPSVCTHEAYYNAVSDPDHQCEHTQRIAVKAVSEQNNPCQCEHTRSLL